MSRPFSFPPSTQWGDWLFYMIHRENERPDWQHDLIKHEGHIGSSDIDILQFDGYTDWTLTVECWFLDLDKWQAFRSMHGTEATMMHRASLTTTAHRSEIHEHPDGPYAEFDDVTLETISDVHPHPAYPDVTVATITFRRPYIAYEYPVYDVGPPYPPAPFPAFGYGYGYGDYGDGLYGYGEEG